MKAWIINKPHLQTRQQKIGSSFMAALSWLLWLYFLLPLFTLGAWLMGIKSLSTEIRWFGGYKTLLELLQIYGYSIAAIAICWLCWTLAASSHKAKAKPLQAKPLNDQTLCETFHITEAQLQQAREAQTITVSFDGSGNITGIRH